MPALRPTTPFSSGPTTVRRAGADAMAGRHILKTALPSRIAGRSARWQAGCRTVKPAANAKPPVPRIPVLRLLAQVVARRHGAAAKWTIISGTGAPAPDRGQLCPRSRCPHPTRRSSPAATRSSPASRRSSATRCHRHRGRAPRLRDRRAHRLPRRAARRRAARLDRGGRRGPALSSARAASRSSRAAPARRSPAARCRRRRCGRRRPRRHEPHPRHRLRQPHRPGRGRRHQHQHHQRRRRTAASSTPPIRRASSPAPSPATSP